MIRDPHPRPLMLGDITPERVLAELRKVLTPIDFKALEAQGIVRRARHGYYLLKPEELPDHARAHITSVEQATL